MKPFSFIIFLISLLTRKKTLALGGALIMILYSNVPVYSATYAIFDRWVTPMQAYAINGDINDPDVYMELKEEFEKAPPGSIEFTLIAVGTKYFDESHSIKNQKIISKHGYTTMFEVLGNFKEFSSASSVSLHNEYGEDEGEENLLGWYAHSFSIYYPNEEDTSSSDDDLEQQEYEKCNGFSGHLSEERYKYNEYIEPEAFYIEIPLPFGYHITGGKDSPNSEMKVIARVDRVKREADTDLNIDEGKEGTFPYKVYESDETKDSDGDLNKLLDDDKIALIGGVIATVAIVGAAIVAVRYGIKSGRVASNIKKNNDDEQ